MLIYKNKLRKLPKLLLSYCYLTCFVIFIYLLAWIIFSKHNIVGVVSIFAGMIKLLLYMIICWELDYRIKDYNINNEIQKLIMITAVINLAAVIYQKIDFNGSVNFLKIFILNDEQIAYLPEQIRGGAYTRYYGIFGYPMNMGTFFLYATVFLFDQNMNKLSKNLLILVCVYLGISSGSKVFILGLVIEIAAFILFPLIVNRAKKKDILRIAICLLAAIIFSAFFEIILEMVTVIFSPGITYRFAFLSDWFGALSTRFNSNTGLVRVASRMLADYWIIGVGPVSIADELIMDNSFYVIMHNGGVVALFAVMYFYINMCRLRVYNRTCIIMVLAIMAAGIAFPTLIASEMSVWVIYYLTTVKKKDLIELEQKGQ